jgi:hypothetical protein
MDIGITAPEIREEKAGKTVKFRDNVACYGSMLSSVPENNPLIRPH